MILKQSTAATVVVGPVLDSAGAAVTTAVAANFSLSKNGTVNALTSETVTHSTNGYYTIALTSSNTDTLGRVEIIVNDSAMSMATHRYNVIVGTSYDLLVTSGGYSTLDAAGIRTAVGLGSANLDTQLSTIDTVVDNIEADTQDIQSRLPESLAFGYMPAYLYGCTASGGDQISVRIATNIVNKSFNWPAAVDEIAGEVWDEPLTGATHNVATSAGRRLRQLGDTVILKDGETVAADNAGVINGTNGLGRIKLQPDVGTVCVGQAVRVTGMVRFIEAYDADTQYATVDAPWCTIPEVGDEYTIFNLRTSLIQRITSAASGTIAFVIAKLWDMIEDVSGYRFTADALEQAPSGGSSITITAGAANAPARSDDTNLIAFVDETISQALAIYEADGTTAKDMSGKTLTVVFENLETTDTAVVPSGSITVSGADNNTVTWAYPSAVTTTVGTYRYALRDEAAPKTVYAQGLLFVKVAAAVDS